jgi:hypothetical protein
MGDTEMPTAWRMESDDLAHAKDVVQMILQDWDFMSRNVLLADDVVLSLKLGAVEDLGGVSGDLQVSGREEAKRAR